MFLYPSLVLAPGTIISSACLTAMNASIACDDYLQQLAQTNYYGSLDNITIQHSVCNPTCGTALSHYHASVLKACASDPTPWTGVPANYYGDLVWATFNQTCFKDPSTGQYCSEYLSSALGSTEDLELPSFPQNVVCSPCMIAMMRHIQSTPYSNYNEELAVQWQLIQHTCGLQYPTAVQPPAVGSSAIVPGFAAVNSTQPQICLSGQNYTVVSGDTLETIAESQKVATGTLRILNDLLPDGSDLMAGATLCLPHTCNTYRVQDGDTCASLTSNNGVSLAQFLAFNPSINGGCTNLQAGLTICLALPGPIYNGTTISGATATQTGSYSTTTAAPPRNIADGTTRHCGRYYEVQAGDYCQKVALNNTIDLSLFLAINPTINSACTNLMTNVSYCVFPTTDWNVTYTVILPPPAATPSGTVGKCYQWHIVVTGDSCYSVEQFYGITFAQLRQWNPSVDADCGNLLLGVAYCVNGLGKTTTTTVSQPPPTPSGVLMHPDLVLQMLKQRDVNPEHPG